MNNDMLLNTTRESDCSESVYNTHTENQFSSRPYTIVHISDPHLSRQFYREHYKSFKILLRTIIERGFDHLVITGDIVSTADPGDYFLAREILTRFGLMDGERLTVVPGNHDIFGGPHRAVDVLSFPRHIRSIDYRRHLQLFEETFHETFNNAISVIPGSRYPFIKRIAPYGLIGLNSVPPWSLKNNPLGSNGLLDDTQLEGLKQLEGSRLLHDTIPIVVLHHHFNDVATDASPSNSLWKKIESKTMRMRKRRKVMRLFNTLNVHSVLHGHIHRNEIYTKDEIQFVNGAGAVCDDPIPMLKYNSIVWRQGASIIQSHILPVQYQVSTTSLPFLSKQKEVAQLAPVAVS
jgi:DNA repair exonuclease SbcCD nuclease subunit